MAGFMRWYGLVHFIYISSFSVLATWVSHASAENASMKVRVTYVGTATMILEVGSQKPLRIFTDPALDEAGGSYKFKLGTGSKKTLGPAVSKDQIGEIDAVLLSHDEHADNLDVEGRRFLPKSKRVITTRSGSNRLESELGEKVTGLNPWESFEIKSDEGWTMKVHAVPAIHGQWPLPEPIVGETIGFVLEWPGQRNGAVYISGDTVFFDGIREIGKRFQIGTAFLHLGSVRFSISGPLRYTFNGADAAKTIQALNLKTIIPIHYDGWTHFKESLETSMKAINENGFQDRVRTLQRGEAVEFDI